MTPGGTTLETTQLNLESLWSGGPFEDSVRAVLALSLRSFRLLIILAVVQRRQQDTGKPRLDEGRHGKHTKCYIRKREWNHL